MTGILTDNCNAVKTIMLEELRNFVGVQPEIVIEGYNIGKQEERNRDIKNRVWSEVIKQYDAATFVSEYDSMD